MAFGRLLWHQGESDAHQKPANEIPAEQYRNMLERIIQASRKQAGWNFPWMVAQVFYHTPDDPSTPALPRHFATRNELFGKPALRWRVPIPTR